MVEIQESKQEENRLEQLRGVIANAGAAIEEEFGRTANDWLSCFGSCVFRVDIYLYSRKVQELLPPEKYEEALSKLERLKEKLYELKKQYPDKETVPPDDIKRGLLKELNVLE
jgi:hypothetical protein